MPLGELLAIQAYQRPNEPALIFAGKRISYKELERRVQSLARGLTQIGVNPGTRVAILLPNSPEYVDAFFALFYMGAVAVPVNSFLAPAEINYILENSGAGVLITTTAYYKKLDSKQSRTLQEIILADGTSDGCLSLEDVRCRGVGVAEPVFADSDAAAIIIYTSGTTGKPKGAVLTHSNLTSNVQSCARAFPKLKSRDRFLVFLPLFHSFTITTSLLLPIFVGARIILLPGIAREQIRQTIIKQKPTIMLGVPTVYNMFANAQVSFFSRLLNPIRVYVCGGAPLAPEIHRQFEKKYKRFLLEGYGLSEASPVVSLNPAGKTKPSSAGLPVPGVRVKVINDQGRDLGTNEVGELLVRGPNVMQGYWRNSEATRQAIKDSWLYTGDLARIDEGGYIYIVGRKKELIIVRGMNVYPREIEEVLYRHPAVAEAAVIGVSDPNRGEIPKGIVALKKNFQVSEKELKDFCRQHLAAYKVPHSIEFRSELPKTGSGKISKRHLRQEHSA